MGGLRCLASAAAAFAVSWSWSAEGATLLRGRAVGEDSVEMEDVAFAVLSCSRYLETRVQAQRRTWLRHIKNVLVSTDDQGGFDPGLPVLVDKTPPQKNERLLGTGADRALGLILAARQQFPDAKWYFFVDDDTYVYVSNLLDDVLRRRNWRSPHYVGWSSPVGPSLEGVFPGQWMPNVAIGGAGFAISQGLMAKLAPEVQRCRREYSWNWQGDIRIAKCIADLGFEVEDDAHLYPEGIRTELSFNASHLNDGTGVPPASFHHLAAEDLDRLHVAHVVSSAHGGVQRRADFGALAFREVSFREPETNRFFRMRFGWQVEVFDANGNRLAADRLTAFAPGPQGVFHQEYRGPQCSDVASGAAAANHSAFFTVTAEARGARSNRSEAFHETVGGRQTVFSRYLNTARGQRPSPSRGFLRRIQPAVTQTTCVSRFASSDSEA